VLTVTASFVQTNTAGDGGGGIHNRDAVAVISNTLVYSNSAQYGGGIWSNGGASRVTVDGNSRIAANVASGYAGGIGNTDGSFTVNASQIYANNGNTYGGGLYDSYSGRLTVNDSQVYSNSAQQGGGVYSEGAAQVTISASTVATNTAGSTGGGLFNIDSSITVTNNSLVRANIAGFAGGGIHSTINTLTATVVVSNSSLLENIAPTGGAFQQAGGTSRVTGNCIVDNSNTAVNYAGGTSPVAATGNWWGHASGPAGAGPGVGDSVSSNVNFSGFLGTAIPACPTIPNADVAIVKTASPSSLIPGQAIIYTLTFSNTGQRFARGVVIGDSVPLSVTVTNVASSGAAITQTGAAPDFVWAVGDLAAGSGGVITLTGTVSNSEAVASAGFTNTATITATGEISFANNTGSAGVTVQPLLLVGGTLSGLAGSGLAVQNNGGDNLALTANGIFTFATPLINGSAYSVTVLTQPVNPPQSCVVTGGSGVVTGAPASSVQIACTTASYPLITATAGTGAGSVSLDPAGGSYSYGTVVNVSATPATGSTFTGWSGACAGTGSCSVTMDAAKAVTATFTLNSYALTTATAGTGSGTVSLSPPGGTYSQGTMVTVTNTPATGSTFTGWSGACTGSGACSVTMDATQSVTATFVAISHSLHVALAGMGGGTVTSSPAGIACGTDCSEALTFGAVTTLTATPAPDSNLSGWSGACSGAAACVVAMDGAKNVTATFTLLAPAFEISAARRNHDPVLPGDTILWDVTITNTGQVTVTVTEITGTLSATVFSMTGAEAGSAAAACAPPVTLAVAAHYRCTLALEAPDTAAAHLEISAIGEGVDKSLANATFNAQPVIQTRLFLPLAAR
jgi:uncharacterized repeat protein (TIGR01451 family)